MIKSITATIALSIGLALIPQLSFADESKCTAEKPCIVKAIAAKVRYYDENLKEDNSEKKRTFNKIIPETGLATSGRKVVKGISMLVLAEPANLAGTLVEETAFQLDPQNSIDCTGIALATVGNDTESTTGVSVGFGDACK